MEMKSRAVKLFCAIAESGSLLAASNKLNLSSSAASRMLSQLEDRLGVKLFERGNKHPQGNMVWVEELFWGAE